MEITPAFVKQYCICLSELNKAQDEDIAAWGLTIGLVIVAVSTLFAVLGACGILATPGSCAQRFGLGAAIYLGLCNFCGLGFIRSTILSVKNYFTRKKIKTLLFSAQFTAVPQSSHDNRKLPNEMVSLIFEHLSPIDIIELRKVCKQWNYVADNHSLWKKHMFSLVPDEEKENFKTELNRDPKAFVTGLYKAKREKICLLALSNQIQNSWFQREIWKFNNDSFKQAFARLCTL